MSSVSSDVQQIFTENPGDLPAPYELTSDISVQSIVARVDGSGAAGAFLPTLSLYSQNGKLIARVPSDITYSVGDTGVVTWSPFLARRVAAAGGAVFAPWAALDGPSPCVTVSGVLFDLSANFSNTYVVGSGTFINHVGPGHIQITQQTIVTATIMVQWAAAFAGPRYLELTMSGGAGDKLIPSSGNIIRSSPGASGDFDLFTAQFEVFINTGPVDLIANVFQASGANQTTSYEGFSVVGHDPTSSP